MHDVGTLPDGRVFYTMKLVQGRRLDQYTAEELVASQKGCGHFRKFVKPSLSRMPIKYCIGI